MKFILQHRHHQPSPFFTSLIREQFELLRDALHIDEVRVLVERRPEASPPFRVAAHLVTPGPDVRAEAADHTLRAALQKTVAQLETRIGHRRRRRARGAKGEVQTKPSATHL